MSNKRIERRFGVFLALAITVATTSGCSIAEAVAGGFFGGVSDAVSVTIFDVLRGWISPG